MSHPKLTFFCELPADELTSLFDGRFVIDDLHDLGAVLSLGIVDLSEERAKLVLRLNNAGVPVIAWLLLPEEEGYWFNLDNYQAAAVRYNAFKAWANQFSLKWAGIGLDIEPDIQDMHMLKEEKKRNEILKKLIQRFKDKGRLKTAQLAYQALIDLIHADGFEVESYQLPIILEERKSKATILQRAAGLVDLESDREVLMLYSSFLRPHGEAVLWSYAPEADSIGVGSTGGGVDIEGVIDLEPLSWAEFSRDLRLCVLQDKPIHIFSLEGCVSQGFLSKLNTFDWDAPVSIPGKTTRIRTLRTGFATLLWILERPWILLVGLISLIGLKLLFKQGQGTVSGE